MTSFLQLAFSLAILIALAKAGGYLSLRLGQPSVLGELVVGILLGPSLINFLDLSIFSDPHLVEIIRDIAEIGVLLLMFMAGLELHINDLARTRRVAALAGSLGVILPILLGIVLGWVYAMNRSEGIYIGLILAATSVSISAQTLMELKVLRSRVGIAMLGAAVLDDILVVLGMAVFTAVIVPAPQSGLLAVLTVLARMALFLAAGLGLGLFILPKWSSRVASLPISQGAVSFAFVILLLYAFAAEAFGGMAAITGAFLAGLVLGRSPVRERILTGISSLSYGIFVPIFFVNVGLSTNIRPLRCGVLAVRRDGDTGDCRQGNRSRAGSLPLWFNRREALQLGVGMMSRGEVGLIVASVGITRGWINQEAFAAVVGVVVITTLITPPLLRWLLQSSSRNRRGTRFKPREKSHELSGSDDRR